MTSKLEMPGCVAQVLSEFADVLPPKLPMTLLQLRETDHKIELYGSMPPAQPSHCMAPKQLVELRKRLNYLLDAGIMHPSKLHLGPSFVTKK